MAEFFGLILSLVFLAFVLLPVLTFLRLGRLSRELEALAERVRSLEQARTPIELGPSVIVPAVAPDRAEPERPAVTPSDLDEAASAAPVAPGAPDFESRIGGRGLLYAGVLVLLFGASFFLKYAFDNAWINQTGRVVIGGLAGGALVGAGVSFAGRGLLVFGQALTGTGLAILYLSIYAALNFYGLVGPAVAFVSMAIVTLASAFFADRLASQAVAIIAVGGGFLTPLLIGGEAAAQTALFTYVTLLLGGTLVLSLRHQWFALNALSYAATILTILWWVDREYRHDLWLRTLLFLTLFCVLFLIILRESMRAPGQAARLSAMLLATAPLFYHLAAVVLTAAHPPAIHVYLIAFTAAGLWLTVDPHRPRLRLLLLLGAFAPLFGTLTLPDGLTWLVPNVITIVAVAALHVMATLDRSLRQQAPLQGADLLALHLSGLGLFALLYESFQPAYPDVRGSLAAIMALGALALWRLLRSRDPLGAFHAGTLACTLVAIGVAVEFDGPPVTVGWAAEGAAVAWLGLRAGNAPFQFGGLLLWMLAVGRLLDRYFDTPAGFSALFNVRAVTTLVVVSLGYGLAWLFNRSHAPAASQVRVGLHIVGSFLTLLWITAEIRSFWGVRFDRSQAYLYEHMMLSLAWGLYGAVLIALGMKRAYPPVRYIGMSVLALTILKVFFYDLWELGGIYRVIGFLGFGVLLVLVSYLYQRRKTVGEADTPGVR